MTISKEAAIAEMKRRGLTMPQQKSFNSNISKQEAVEEMKRRGMQFGDEAKGWSGVGQDILEGAMNVPGSLYNMAVELPGEAYGAAKQAFTDPRRLLQNVGQGAVNVGQGISNFIPNMRDYLREKDLLTQEQWERGNRMLPKVEPIDIGELTGRGKNIPGDALISALTEYALPLKAAKFGTAGTGLLRKGLQQSAAIGAHEIGQGRNPITGILNPLAVEAGIKGTTGAIKSAGKLKSANIANRIMEDRANLRNEFTTEYGDIFNKAKELGGGDVSIPKMNSSNIIKNLTLDDAQVFKQFLKEPTIENAHWAKSDLGKKIDSLKNAHVRNPLSSSKLKALRDMEVAQKRINKEMSKAFDRTNQPDLTNRYKEVTARYGEEMMPYETKLFKQFAKPKFGKETGMTPAKFIKKLSKNDDFNMSLAERYPEVSRNIFSRKLGKAALLGGAASTVGYPAYHLGKHFVNGIFE